MAWLIRREGVVPVLVEGEITIGRASYSNIWLDDSAVSRTHCRLSVKKGQLILRDASSNGTFVNGVRIGSSAHLSHGDKIQVAGHQLTVQETPAPPERPVVSISPPPMPMPEAPAPSPQTQVPAGPVPIVVMPAPVPPRPSSRPPPATAPIPAPMPPAPMPPAVATALAAPTVVPAPPIVQAPVSMPVMPPPPIVPEAMFITGEIPAVAVPPHLAGPAPASASFQVQVVEDQAAPASPVRYRDAVRLVDGNALAVMTDILGEPQLAPDMVIRWKTAVRAAGSRGLGPDAVLQVLNTELFSAGLQATACCAWLDPKERLLAVSCAGMPPPWIIRSSRKIVRVQITASVGLGAVKSAQWASRTLHFEKGDTLLMPSTAWTTPLEQTLEGNLPDVSRLPEWLRGHPGQPPRGSAICLTMT